MIVFNWKNNIVKRLVKKWNYYVPFQNCSSKQLTILIKQETNMYFDIKLWISIWVLSKELEINKNFDFMYGAYQVQMTQTQQQKASRSWNQTHTFRATGWQLYHWATATQPKMKKASKPAYGEKLTPPQAKLLIVSPFTGAVSFEPWQ